jgi:hypothetical protein
MGFVLVLAILLRHRNYLLHSGDIIHVYYYDLIHRRMGNAPITPSDFGESALPAFLRSRRVFAETGFDGL